MLQLDRRMKKTPSILIAAPALAKGGYSWQSEMPGLKRMEDGDH